MRWIRFTLFQFVASLSLLSSVSCQVAPSEFLIKEKYKQVFSEDFSRFDLSADGFGDHVWYNGIWFSHRVPPNSMIELHNGYLTLHCKAQLNGPDTSITTLSRDNRHYRAWRYGYFEARMRWKPVPGAFPAFWLIPVEGATRKALKNGVLETGEIDIFEGQGDRPFDYYATLHRWHNNNDVQNTSTNNRFFISPVTDYSQWHTYGVLWTPKQITWFMDNKPIHSEEAYPILNEEQMFLVLSAQVGSWRDRSLTKMNAVDLPLDIQWVRVWQNQQSEGSSK